MKPIRLILNTEQTAAIAEQAGEHTANVFVCIGPGSMPDAAGKLVAYFLPCESVEVANGAVRVAMGEAKVSKPRKPRSSRAAEAAKR